MLLSRILFSYRFMQVDFMEASVQVYMLLNDIHRDGMGSAAMTLMDALKQSGVDVMPLHAYRDIHLPGYEEKYNPHFVEGNERYGTDRETVRRMVATLNAVCPHDSVVMHFGSPNWAACIPYLREEVRVIVAVHSLNPSTAKICSAYAERVSAFVCISEGVRQRFLRRLPKRFHGRVTLIPNAVEISDCPKTTYSATTPFRILYVGRIENTSKGCGKLPKILAQLKRRGVPAELDLYGYFHNWEASFWKAVDKASVRGMVRYRGEIERSRMYGVMREYDAFIAPSNFEGFGLSIAEAMTCGVPCVVSRIRGVTDWLLQDGAAGMLVDKTDITGFADALEALRNDLSLAERIGQAGRERIRDLASFESHGKAYAALIARVTLERNYTSVTSAPDLDHYVFPECLKSWGPARLLPIWLKSWLRRFM